MLKYWAYFWGNLSNGRKRLIALVSVPSLLIYEWSIIYYCLNQKEKYEGWIVMEEIRNGPRGHNYDQDVELLNELLYIEMPLYIVGVPTGILLLFVLIAIASLWVAEGFGYKIAFKKLYARKSGLNE